MTAWVWSYVAIEVTDDIFDAFAEPVSVNGSAVQAIVLQETVDIGDYASVALESRWRIYARKADIEKFQRNDLIDAGGKSFRVESPDGDDGIEVTAWLREISGNV